jgi:hypothetical protein
MARLEEPPFERGSTFYNGGVIDPNNLGGLNLEGKEWWFEDIDLTSGGNVGAKQTRTGRYVKARVIRNVSGATFLPKRIVSMQAGGADGRYLVGRADGYALGGLAANSPPTVVVDEYIPPNLGVPNNDLFWGIVEGPAMVTIALAGVAANVTIGDPITATAGTVNNTSGATSAGRATNALPSGAASYDQTIRAAMGVIGRALSAATAAATSGPGSPGQDLLVDIGAGFW